MKSARLILAGVVTAVIGLHTTDSFAQTKLRVAFLSTSGSAPLFIAKDKGIFAKNGLDVDLVQMRGASDSVPGLVSKSLDIATVPNTSLVLAVDSGIDLVAISGISRLRSGSRDAALVARTGVDIKSTADLKGKRVLLINIGSISQVLLEKWLMMKGLTNADIKTISYSEGSLPQMPDIIKTGSVHAAVTVTPFTEVITRANTGHVVSWFMGEMPDDTQTGVMVATRDWTDSHAKEVAAFRTSIHEAVEYVRANQDDGRAVISKYLGQPPAVVAQTPYPDGRATVTVSDMKWWIDTLAEQQRLRTKLDPANLIAK